MVGSVSKVVVSELVQQLNAASAAASGTGVRAAAEDGIEDVLLELGLKPELELELELELDAEAAACGAGSAASDSDDEAPGGCL